MNILALLFLSVSLSLQAGPSSHMVSYTIEDSFDNVKQDVEDAITAKGLKVSNISYIGKMLKRTAKDVGASGGIYHDAVALEFCSATLSREMMQTNPDNIVFCPYIIYVYALSGETGKTTVAYRKFTTSATGNTDKTLSQVEALLESIINELK